MRLINHSYSLTQTSKISLDFSLGIGYWVLPTGANSLLYRLILGGVSGLNRGSGNWSHTLRGSGSALAYESSGVSEPDRYPGLDWEVASVGSLGTNCRQVSSFSGIADPKVRSPSLLSTRCGNSSSGRSITSPGDPVLSFVPSTGQILTI